MKNSRKIKKVLVSILTATLSIIMFVTQVGALDAVTYNATFEEEAEIVSAFEYMAWVYRPNRESFTMGVDLECYENADIDYVYAGIHYNSYYPSVANAEYRYTAPVESGMFTYLNTEESDELLIFVPDFGLGYENIEVIAFVTYTIYYCNGLEITYQYRHNAQIVNSEFTHERTLIHYYYDDTAVVE